MEAQIPNYPSLPPQLICQLHNVTMHVSSELYSSSVPILYCCHLYALSPLLMSSFRPMQRQMRYMRR
jgi:hypothetical protein